MKTQMNELKEETYFLDNFDLGELKASGELIIVRKNVRIILRYEARK